MGSRNGKNKMKLSGEAKMKLLGEDKNILEYDFTFSDKQVISSTIIIYTSVKFKNDVSFGAKNVPSDIVYDKLIAKPSSRLYFLLCDKMSPVIALKCYIYDTKQYSTIYDDSSTGQLILEDDDLRNAYIDLRWDHWLKFVNLSKFRLEEYLPRTIVNIIIEHLEYSVL